MGLILHTYVSRHEWVVADETDEAAEMASPPALCPSLVQGDPGLMADLIPLAV